MANNKLTKKTNTSKSKKTLTSKNEVKFKLLFGNCIQSGYDFKAIQKVDAHKLMRFVGDVVGRDWSYVESKYGRIPDKRDSVNGHDIIHYGYSDGSRIHGYEENGVFVLVRFDPSHKFHNG